MNNFKRKIYSVRRFSESPEQKSDRRIAVGVLGGATTATAAGLGYLSGQTKEIKDLRKENITSSQKIKDLEISREKYLESEKSKMQTKLNDKIKEIKGKTKEETGKLKKEAGEKGRDEIDAKMESLKKRRIKADTKMSEELTTKIKQNKGMIKKLSGKSRKRALIGAGIGAAATIAGNHYLKKEG